MMIKHEGKMVPAKKVDGKWVPDIGAKLVHTKDGLRVDHGDEPAAPATEEPEEKKGFLGKLMGK